MAISLIWNAFMVIFVRAIVSVLNVSETVYRISIKFNQLSLNLEKHFCILYPTIKSIISNISWMSPKNQLLCQWQKRNYGQLLCFENKFFYCNSNVNIANQEKILLRILQKPNKQFRFSPFLHPHTQPIPNDL